MVGQPWLPSSCLPPSLFVTCRPTLSTQQHPTRLSPGISQTCAYSGRGAGMDLSPSMPLFMPALYLECLPLPSPTSAYSSLTAEMRSLPPESVLGPPRCPHGFKVLCSHLHSPAYRPPFPISLRPCVLLSHHLLHETAPPQGGGSLGSSLHAQCHVLWAWHTSAQQKFSE